MNANRFLNFKIVSTVFTILAFIVSIGVIYGFIRDQGAEVVASSILAFSPGTIVFALCLSLLGYTVFGFYDYLAVKSLGKHISLWFAFPLAFMCYALGNNIGFANIGSFSIRTKYYIPRGFSVVDIAGVMLHTSATYWTAFLLFSSFFFILYPFPLSIFGLEFLDMRLMGVFSLMALIAYLVLCATFRKPIPRLKTNICFPKPGMAVKQLIAGCIDWLLAGFTLYVLLPENTVPVGFFFSVFLVAYGLTMLTTIPGGIGLLEALLLGFLPSTEEGASQIFAALMVYRVLYFIVPLALLPLIMVATDRIFAIKT